MGRVQTNLPVVPINIPCGFHVIVALLVQGTAEAIDLDELDDADGLELRAPGVLHGGVEALGSEAGTVKKQLASHEDGGRGREIAVLWVALHLLRRRTVRVYIGSEYIDHTSRPGGCSIGWRSRGPPIRIRSNN